MANVGETLPHCTGTGTQADPYIYTTEEGFMEAIAVMQSYVEAGQSNLLFDANNGVITQVTFRCSYIDGKGTTIRNLFTQNSGTNLIYFNVNHSVDIYNINFYNMCIITTTSWQRARFIFDSNDNGSDHNKFFKNCNFTGIYKGYPLGDNWGLISSFYSNGSAYHSMIFKDCTFNFNLSMIASGNNANTVIFQMNGYNSLYAIELSNCTICISGKTPTSANYPVYLCKGTIVLDSCVFTNSPTNPLSIANGSNFNARLILETSTSGRKYSTTYNYFKMYINGNGLEGKFECGNSHILINTSRITGVPTITGGIQMQETDPTADDYIYDTNKLAAKGFMVGQVIE